MVFMINIVVALGYPFTPGGIILQKNETTTADYIVVSNCCIPSNRPTALLPRAQRMPLMGLIWDSK
jgi:hypothetical protein